MQPTTVASALALWIDEQRPYVLRFSVSYGERNDVPLFCDDSATARDFKLGEVVLLPNSRGGEPVLAHRKANAVHAGDVLAYSLPQHSVHLARPNV